MNISGILVQTKPENTGSVAEVIKKSDFCEYHFHDDKGRIIVTLEGENTEEEIKKLKKLQAIENVISADMVYAYSENELDMLREGLDKNEKLPEWLNDPDAKPEDIRYNGDLKKKFF